MCDWENWKNVFCAEITTIDSCVSTQNQGRWCQIETIANGAIHNHLHDQSLPDGRFLIEICHSSWSTRAYSMWKQAFCSIIKMISQMKCLGSRWLYSTYISEWHLKAHKVQSSLSTTHTDQMKLFNFLLNECNGMLSERCLLQNNRVCEK